MPSTVETHERIAAAPAQVFALLAEPRAWKRWWPAVGDARTLDGKALREGSRCEITFQMGLLTATLRPRVTLFADGRSLVWEGRWFGVPLRQEWFVEPRPEGTRVVARARFTGPGAPLLHLARLDRRWQGMLAEQLRALRRTAESL
jgi:uncharacterized protein YndB with AHSA1/START domain